MSQQRILPPQVDPGAAADGTFGLVVTSGVVVGLGEVAVSSGSLIRQDFTATASQTVFTLSESDPDVVIVSLNGQILDAADYAVSGTTLTLDTGAVLNDAVSVFWNDATTPTTGSSRPYLTDLPLHGTYGDDFNAASLDAKWTRRNITGGMEAYQQGSGSYMDVDLPSTNTSYQYHQAAPAGDYEIVMAFSMFANVNAIIGPMIIDASGDGRQAFIYTNGFGLYLGTLTTYLFSATAASTSFHTLNPYAMQPLWLGLAKVGTTYTSRFSMNGETWSPGVSAVWAGTPDRIGFGRTSTDSTVNRISIDVFNVI